MTIIKYFIERQKLFLYQKECEYYRNKLLSNVGNNEVAKLIGEYSGVIEKRDSLYIDTLIDDYRIAVDRLSTQVSIVKKLSSKLFGE